MQGTLRPKFPQNSPLAFILNAPILHPKCSIFRLSSEIFLSEKIANRPNFGTPPASQINPSSGLEFHWSQTRRAASAGANGSNSNSAQRQHRHITTDSETQFWHLKDSNSCPLVAAEELQRIWGAAASATRIQELQEALLCLGRFNLFAPFLWERGFKGSRPVVFWVSAINTALRTGWRTKKPKVKTPRELIHPLGTRFSALWHDGNRNTERSPRHRTAQRRPGNYFKDRRRVQTLDQPFESNIIS